MIKIFVFIIGTCFGSFITVLMHRIYNRQTGILLGRSKCTHCNRVLRANNLIPIISYIIQGGRCSFCNKSISLFYPLVELVTGITFLLIYLKFQGMPTALPILHSIIFTALIFTFFYDLKHYIISDRVLLPTIILTLLLPFFGDIEFTFTQRIIGLLIPTCFFLTQILLSNGKWLGGGDLRIGALMGALLGIKGVIVALVFSYFIGSIVSILLIITKQLSRKSMIPFGPFLVTGTYIAFFWGNSIVNWYINFIGV